MALRRAHTRWLVVVLFAIAMAWLEAATVYYLRVLVGRLNPYQPNPLPVQGILGQVELVREAATLVMLLTVGTLAGRTWQARLGYAAIAFGVWDIFYYLFLKAIYDWPQSLFDWDILFLLPLPWWGPVLAPISVALLMIVWGTLICQRADRESGASVASTRVLGSIGITLALYAFMADALHVAHLGIDATRTVLPTTFNWSVFAAALTLMAAPVAHMTWRRRLRFCPTASARAERSIGAPTPQKQHADGE
jgi:hypothetical protein